MHAEGAVLRLWSCRTWPLLQEEALHVDIKNAELQLDLMHASPV